MMTEDECIAFMRLLAKELIAKFGEVLEEHLPPNKEVPAQSVLAGIGMFAATITDRIYGISGAPMARQVQDVKEFCNNLERAITLLIQRRNIH